MIGYKVLSINQDGKSARVKYFNPHWDPNLVVIETYTENVYDENGNASAIEKTREVDNNLNLHHEHEVILPDPIEGEEYDITFRRLVEQIANGVEVKMDIRRRQLSEALLNTVLNIEFNVPTAPEE